MQKENPIILFDGVCNLCNGAIDFIIKKDKEKLFRFVPLQSEIGKELIENYNIPPETDSVILVFQNHLYVESEASMQILRLLPAPWKWLSFFKIIPMKFRNGIYKWIAKKRYRWFGKRGACRGI